MGFEALFGDGIVGLELDPHVVVLGGDDVRLLGAAELAVQLGVGGQPAAHLHEVVFADLRGARKGRGGGERQGAGGTAVPPCQPPAVPGRRTRWRGAAPRLTHVIALGLEEVELQGDAVLGGGHQLPDAVLVGGVLLRPPRAGDGAVELGEETSAGGCRVGGTQRPSRPRAPWD